MAFTGASSGMGSQIAFGDGTHGGSVTYIKVGEVTNVKPPAIGWNTEDATHLDSPDKLEEYIKTTMTAADAGFDFNYPPSAADTIFAASVVGDVDVQITYPNGVKMQFSGIITSYDPGAITSGKMAGSVVIKPTSLPVLIAA
jgi:hypothetical protein